MLDSDAAAALKAMVDDAAAIILDDAARTLAELQSVLGDAFSTGTEPAWRAAYEAMDRVVSRAGGDPNATVDRLRSFLRENEDLAHERDGTRAPRRRADLRAVRTPRRIVIR
jgi:hypothetical protein